MFDADQIIYEAAAQRLANASIAQRRQILLALLAKITIKHPAWKNVSAQLALLETLGNLQRELPLEFRKRLSGPGDGKPEDQ